MKKIILLLFCLYSFSANSQTVIPLAGFKAQLDVSPTVVGDTIIADFNITDFSNQFNGLDLSDTMDLVVWKNCNRYEVVEITTAFASQVSLKLIKDGNPNMTIGSAALLQESEIGISHLINGITESDKQCIDSYYRKRTSAIVDSACNCIITANEDTLFVGDSFVLSDNDNTNELTDYVVSDTEPNKPKEGDIWISTNNNTIYIYDSIIYQLLTDDFSRFNEGEISFEYVGEDHVGFRSNTNFGKRLNLIGTEGITIDHSTNAFTFGLDSRSLDVDDDDPDPQNEIQIITISNDTIYLSDGGFVVLPESISSWNELTDIPVGFADGVDDVDDADNDPTNEIETWATLSGIPTDIADGDDVGLFEQGIASNEAVYLGSNGSNAQVGINTNNPDFALDLHSDDLNPMRILADNTNGTAKDGDIVFQEKSSGDIWNLGIKHAIYDHFQISGNAGGTGMLFSNDNRVGFGSLPLANRKFHVSGDIGVATGDKFYFGQIDSRTRLTSPSTTSFAVENGSIELLRITRIASSDALLRVPQYSIGATADTYPAYSFSDDVNSGLYKRNDDEVGLTTGGVGRLYVTNTDAYLTSYDETRNDGIGVNFLYTDNGKVQSGQLLDLFTQYETTYTPGSNIGITNGVINNLAPTPFAYGFNNDDIFYNAPDAEVGFGTSTPSSTLDVHGSMNFTRKNGTLGIFSMDYGPNTQFSWFEPSTDYLALRSLSNGMFRMMMDSFQVESVLIDNHGDIGDPTKTISFDIDGKMDIVDIASGDSAYGALVTSGVSSINSTSETKVNFNSTVGTADNTTASPSANRITVDNGGVYLVNVDGFVNDYTIDEVLIVRVHVNGVSVESDRISAFDEAFDINLTDLIILSDNDYVELYVDSDSDNDYFLTNVSLALVRVN